MIFLKHDLKIFLVIVLLFISTIVIHNVSGHDYSVTLKPGEERQLFTDTNPWSDAADATGVIIHGWTDASGSAASWVTPNHIEFGDNLPGDHLEFPYTIKVPDDQEPGYYELVWTNNCTSNTSGPCYSSVHTVSITIEPKLVPTVPIIGGGAAAAVVVTIVALTMTPASPPSPSIPLNATLTVRIDPPRIEIIGRRLG